MIPGPMDHLKANALALAAGAALVLLVQALSRPRNDDETPWASWWERWNG